METIFTKHTDLVHRLCKPGQDIITDLTPAKAHLWHMSSCLMGEAGELFDAVKGFIIYSKGLSIENRDNIVEELGDMEFYMQGLRSVLGITREQTLNANIAKLEKRYHQNTFSNQQAQERKDKQ